MPAAESDGGSQEVLAAIDGDDQARSALWRVHRRWLAAILLAHKPREMDVEDLMQEVAVKFVTKLHTLRDPAAFRPWLRQIALNAARESARGVRRDREDREVFEPDTHEGIGDLGPAGSGESDPEVRDEAAGLLACAQSLPPDFREPVLLRCVRGMSCKQIAEVLDLPVTTIETRLSRGRRMLREEWLKKNAPEEETDDPSPSPASPSASTPAPDAARHAAADRR